MIAKQGEQPPRNVGATNDPPLTSAAATASEDNQRQQQAEAAAAARISLMDRSEEVQIQVDTFLAGFTLFGLALVANDEIMSITRPEAHALALQLIAFGGFVCAIYCHALYLQREQPIPTWYEELLVKVGQYVSVGALCMLLASVAITTKLQMGRKYERYWTIAVTVMIILAVLPILLDLLITLNRFGRRTKLLFLYDVILRLDWLVGRLKNCCFSRPMIARGEMLSWDAFAAFLEHCMRRDEWEESAQANNHHNNNKLSKQNDVPGQQNDIYPATSTKSTTSEEKGQE